MRKWNSLWVNVKDQTGGLYAVEYGEDLLRMSSPNGELIATFGRLFMAVYRANGVTKEMAGHADWQRFCETVADVHGIDLSPFEEPVTAPSDGGTSAVRATRRVS